MTTADTAIRIRLATSRKAEALKAIRGAAGPAFRLYQTWGLVENADEGVRAFVGRVGDTDALWELARKPSVSPIVLSLLIQILSEAYQEHLLSNPDARPSHENPRLPVPTAAIRKTIKDLRAAANALREPLHPELSYMASPELAEELETRAKCWEPLLNQLEQWEPPRRKRGRPLDPRSSIEECVRMILGGTLKEKEANRWAARIAAEFLADNVRATPDHARRRKSERERVHRRRSGGPKGNK